MRILISATLIGMLATVPLTARAPSKEAMLAGRIPGQPTACITQSRINTTTIFDDGSILYRMNGGQDYLNTPIPHCANLRHNRIIVSRTYSNQLCRGDILQVHDQSAGGMWMGACPLGDFVPYPRVKRSQ